MSRSRPPARWLSAGLALLLVAGLAPLRAQDGDPLEAKAFEVRYRELAAAADVVVPLLSDEGTLTLRPRLSTLVVEDRRSVLRRIEVLLGQFDLPPRSVEVTLSLFLGIDRNTEQRSGARGSAFSREVRGIAESLGDFTKWTNYEPLGSRSVTGVEGETVEASLSVDYRVRFVVDFVDEANRRVKFQRLALQRLSLDDEGTQTVEDLYATAMLVPLGKLTVVGAASGPDADRALFLTLQTAEKR